MIDLQAAADRMKSLIGNASDGQLDGPTPCPESSVGDLVDHVSTFTVAFGRVARKDPRLGPPPTPDAANLGPDWRQRIARQLDALADAWRDPAAWEGMTNAGGLDLPGEVAGLVTLDELVVHGWDIAVATGQEYDPAEHEVNAARSFVENFDAPRDGNLFGPVVPVPADAPPLHQLLGLTGRDPDWRPPG